MVWNVTKDDIRVRMSAIDEEVWPRDEIRAAPQEQEKALAVRPHQA